jgi:TetR/AcrR family transcriptional regulator, transcriptional repressor for nem operon
LDEYNYAMGTKADLNRQHIIDTADNLFYRQGFDHTSFSDIADAAGIARGNFYYYFKTKDDLLAAVLLSRSKGIKDMLDGWDKQMPDPRQRLNRYVQILTNSQHEIKEFGCPMGSLCTELAKLRHALQFNANDMFEIFRSWLREQFSLLGRRDDADQLALHLIARSQGIALVANTYQDAAFLEREVKELNRWIAQL